MSIRVYLTPEFVPTGKHPHQGCHYYRTSTGAELSLFSEGGVFYFTLSTLMDPIHPEVRPHINIFTYKESITDLDTVQKVKAGTYRHGKFLAYVELNGDGKNRIRQLTISAKAPNLSLLSRWLRPLLAAADKPVYTQSSPQPIPSASPTVS